MAQRTSGAGAPTTLAEGVIGESYRVLSLEGMAPDTVRRLESVGMTVGTVVAVLNNKSRGTVVIRLRGTRWALGRTISSHVAVEPAPPAPPSDDLEGPPLVPTSAGCVIGAPGIDGIAVEEAAAALDVEGGEAQ